jgi:hypothetical protein
LYLVEFLRDPDQRPKAKKKKVQDKKRIENAGIQTTQHREESDGYGNENHIDNQGPKKT